MISKENLLLLGTITHYFATKSMSPIDWDFHQNNVFTSTRHISRFRIFRSLCLFNFLNVIAKTILRKVTGPVGDFLFLWVFTVMYTTHCIHVSVFLFHPKEFTNAFREFFKLMKHFDGKLYIVLVFLTHKQLIIMFGMTLYRKLHSREKNLD